MPQTEKKTPEEILWKVYRQNSKDRNFSRHSLDWTDALEAMREFARQERDEWISVEDRLPGLGQHVIIYIGNSHEVISVRWVKGCLRFYKEHHITHWQPLPSPPKTNEI